MSGIHAVAAAFYPINSVFVQISDRTTSGFASGTAVAAYEISSDGKVRDWSLTILESWLRGAGGTVSNYEARATLKSGTLSSGTTGTWANCSSSPNWVKQNSSRNGSTQTAVILVEIRDVATQTVQTSATITLSAESDGGDRTGIQ